MDRFIVRNPLFWQAFEPEGAFGVIGMRAIMTNGPSGFVYTQDAALNSVSLWLSGLHTLSMSSSPHSLLFFNYFNPHLFPSQIIVAYSPVIKNVLVTTHRIYSTRAFLKLWSRHSALGPSSILLRKTCS